MLQDPKSKYGARLEALRQSQSLLDRRHRMLGSVNLALALAGLIVVGWAMDSRSVSILWVLVPGTALAISASIHARVLGARRKGERAIAFYQRGLARLDNRWMGTGATGEQFLDQAHPYSRALDVFGKGSLFEFLCTARTGAGGGSWRWGPPPPQAPPGATYKMLPAAWAVAICPRCKAKIENAIPRIEASKVALAFFILSSFSIVGFEFGFGCYK